MVKQAEPDDVKRIGKEVFVLGLDLGQAADYSALATLVRWQETRLDRDSGKRSLFTCYRIRGLKRWPLGTLYTAIAEDLAAAVAKEPLKGCILGIDQTGVGAGVREIIDAAKPQAKLKGVLITAGHKITHEDGIWHVPKKELVACLQAVLQSRRLEIPKELPEAETLVKELRAFKAKITAAKNETFEADWRNGAHDDLVLAVAIALFLARRVAPDVHAMPTAWGGSGCFDPHRAVLRTNGGSR